MKAFKGLDYRDDRLFVLYVAKCYLAPPEKGMAHTTIFHEEPHSPPSPGDKELWCVITYRNVERYPISRLAHFSSKSLAETYLKNTEPTTPLISLEGKALSPRPTLEEWAGLKKKFGWKEYDYRLMYLPGGRNPSEAFVMEASAVQIYSEG